MSIDDATYVLRNKNPRCKCGDFKKTMNSPQSKVGQALYRNCGKIKCEHNYGKKRPEHSQYMKKLAKSNNTRYTATLMKKGQLFNKEVNSVSFKRKFLSNKKIETEHLNDNEVLKVFADYKSKLVKSREYRTKEIISFFKKNTKQELDIQKINKLSVEQFNRLFYLYKSEHHDIFCSAVCNAKCYKRSLLTDLKFNIRGLTSVYTRSSYDTNYILYFEKNKIRWDYEFKNFRLPAKKYKPDFYVNYNQNKYIIEAKGFLLDEKEYFDLNVYPLLNIISPLGVKYIFSYKSEPYQDFTKFLIEHEVKQKC